MPRRHQIYFSKIVKRFYVQVRRHNVQAALCPFHEKLQGGPKLKFGGIMPRRPALSSEKAPLCEEDFAFQTKLDVFCIQGPFHLEINHLRKILYIFLNFSAFNNLYSE